MTSILLSPPEGDENFTMHLAGVGSLLTTSRPPKICDVCASSKAELYCAADDAYLCTMCDIEVHTANSLAQRHERVRLGANGAPMKIDRKGGGGDSQRINSAKKADSGMVSVLSANSGSSISGSKKRKKGKRSGRPNSYNTPVDNYASSAAIESKPKSTDRGSDGAQFNGNARFPSPHSLEQMSSAVKVERTSDFLDDCVNIKSFLDSDMGGDLEDDMNEMLHAMEYCESMNALGFPDARPMDDEFTMEFTSPLPHFSSSTEVETPSTRPQSSITTSQVENSSVSTLLLNSSDCLDNLNVNGIYTANPESDVFIKREISVEEGLNTNWQDSGLGSELGNGFHSCLNSHPSLQLDYEDVLHAWSSMHGSGSLWISSPSAVSAPTDHDDSSTSETRAALAKAFELSSAKNGNGGNDGGGEECGDAEDRSARVLRYREKRRNRLFCKTIRYEVRKLNAERRPRIKGRFVKRCDGDLA